MPADIRTRKQAEKLARHAAERTPEGARTAEGEIAHRKLIQLAEKHPDLADLLEDASASEDGSEDLMAPTPAHRHALERMALATGADVRIYPHAGADPSYRVFGTRAEVQRFVRAWTEHCDALDLAIQVVGEAWAEMAFPEGTTADEVEEPEVPANGETTPAGERHPVEDPGAVAWAAAEASRMERVGARAQRIHAERLFAGMRRTLAPVLEEQEGRTVRALLGSRGRAWDDARLTFEEFRDLFRATFPKSRRTDPALRVLYRDGIRVHPGTKELRRLRKLAREDWDF